MLTRESIYEKDMAMSLPIASTPLRFTISLVPRTKFTYGVKLKELNNHSQDLFRGSYADSRAFYLDTVHRILQVDLWKLIGQSDSGDVVYTIAEWCGDFSKIFKPSDIKEIK